MKKTLLSLLLVMLFISGLSGCAAKEKPEDTIVTFLDAFKEKKIIDYASLFDGDVSDMTGDPFASPETPNEVSTKLMELILSYDYEIKETVISEDGLSATVSVEFTTVNLGLIITTYMSEYMVEAFKLAFSGGTEEELYQLSIDLFMDASEGAAKDKVTTVEVKMVKVDKKWLIQGGEANLALFDGLMGGLLSTIEELRPSGE
jgi:hypothetical protein